MGAVYRATDEKAQTEVAVKIVRPEFTADPRTRRRFNKEARAFSYLKHPNIVTVLDFGQDEDGTLYLIMELVEGQSLRSWKEKALPLYTILRIVDQLLDALAHAHARGVIHRDLKPENVLVMRSANGIEPIVKLVDFGLAGLPVVASGASHQTGTIIGTPSYMAPEQARGAKGVVGPGTDIYAVGVMLYELVCDRLPYEAEGSIELILKHVQQPIPPLRPRPDLHLPPAIGQSIQRAMAKKPWDRFVNAADFRRSIRAIEVDPSPMPVMEPMLVTADDLTPSEPIVAAALVSSSATEFKPHVEVPTPFSPAKAIRTPSDLFTSVPLPKLEQNPTPTAGVPSVSSMTFAHGMGALIGRDAELERLEEICERALSGQGQIVVIEGEAGIGKSRLGRALLHKFTETGLMRAVVGLYTATEGNGTNVGLRGALEALFNTTDLDRSAMGAQARWVLERLDINDEHDKLEIIEFLRPSAELEADQLGKLAEAAVKRHRSRLALIQRLIRLVAQEMPFVLLLEDVHWATDGIMGFLDSLATSFRLHATPFVVVCTVTPNELASHSLVQEGLGHLSRFEGMSFHRVSLQRLSPERTLELIRATLPLEDSLAERLAVRAGGNPFYALHFVQSLKQDRRLERDGDSGRWKLRDDVVLESALPTSVADVLRRRIQRVQARLGERSEVYYEVLVRAAVLGTSCDDKLLEAFIANEGEEGLRDALDDALDVWINSGILKESTERQADILEFDHPLLRDVLLEGIPARKIRRLHKLAASTKRDYYYPYLQGVARDIAEHYRNAGELDQASEYQLLAARSAESAGNFKEAAQYFGQLLDVFRQQQLTAEDESSGAANPYHVSKSGLLRVSVDWTEVWLGLARIAVAQGEYDVATRHIEQLVQYAEVRAQLLPQARANWLLARISTRRGRLVDAWDLFGMARDLFEAESDMIGVAQCLWGIGEVAQLSGWLTEAREWLGEARSIYESADRPIDVATCLMALGSTALSGGVLEEAREHYELARATFEGAQDRYNVNYCRLGLARVDIAQGRIRDALLLFEEAIATFAELGDRHGQIDCLNGIGHCYLVMGRSEPARAHLAEALTGYKQLNDRHGEGHNLRIQSDGLRWRNAGTEAIQFLNQALDHLTTTGDRNGQASCYLQLSRIALSLEDTERAERHFNEAHELYTISSDAIGIASCAEVWAHICVVRGDFREALTAVQEGLLVAEKTGSGPLLARLLALGTHISAHEKQFSELRHYGARLEDLDSKMEFVREPVFLEALVATTELLQVPGVDPDLRGFRERILQKIEKLRAVGKSV
ncbi:MAG: hypothetical protein AUK47_28615 [Deltaproteobacteria bacterium CG2_30_63_29]|nr:MAG: hypothetical protein AUK47_28615 [Deltaproteobacteria bacterium CG2_30_63_29]